MNHRRLVILTLTEGQALSWMIQNNYLKSERVCEFCRVVMEKERTRPTILRCRFCDHKKSIFKDSVLYNANISIVQFLDFLYFWLMDCVSAITRNESDIKSNKTSVKWSRVINTICYNKMRTMVHGKIGGRGHIVEIDESLFSKRKYNTGRGVRVVWVVGGIDLTTRECFFVEVLYRDRVTLSQVIIEHVLEGTIIWTDCWGGYVDLNEIGFHHETVNHSLYFVDPLTGVNTQLIESTWGALKRKLRARGVSNRSDLSLFFASFLFKRKYKDASFTVILENLYE